MVSRLVAQTSYPVANLDRLRRAWLDRAVWAAYAWDDPDPAAVDEDTTLARLLALNGERAAG